MSNSLNFGPNIAPYPAPREHPGTEPAYNYVFQFNTLLFFYSFTANECATDKTDLIMRASRMALI